MRKLRVATLLVTAALVGLAGCVRDESAARRAADRTLTLQPGPAAFKCHDLLGVIPINEFVEGKTCSQNMAVVNGWSELCVAAGQCNTPARLNETNRAAEDFCADWCAKKDCGYRYTKHTACDSQWCLASNRCQQNCNVPLMDACFFQQAAPNYNCECKVRVEN